MTWQQEACEHYDRIGQVIVPGFDRAFAAVLLLAAAWWRWPVHTDGDHVVVLQPSPPGPWTSSEWWVDATHDVPPVFWPWTFEAEVLR